MVELRKIDADNYLKILGMELPSRQQSFVASNAVSLAQAWVFYDTAHPFAIYHDDEPVGFVMFDFGKGPREVEIWRFMIAPEHQGKGYGTAALRAAVAWLKEQNRFDRVRINYVEGNGAAQAVYRKVGFRETGEREGAEVVMTMPLACSADVPEGACVIDRETLLGAVYAAGPLLCLSHRASGRDPAGGPDPKEGMQLLHRPSVLCDGRGEPAPGIPLCLRRADGPGIAVERGMALAPGIP